MALDQSARYSDLSLKEDELISNGKHMLVAYHMEPQPGHAYLESAAHFAAESSTGTNVEVCTTDDFTKGVDALVYEIDEANLVMKIAYPNELFDRNVIDGRAMIVSFLTLVIGNNQGMGDIKEAKRLCAKYADLWSTDNKHWILLNTIEHSSLKMVKLMVAYNSDLTRNNNRALRLAVALKRDKVATYLSAAINMEDPVVSEDLCGSQLYRVEDLLVIIENQDRELVRLRDERDNTVVTTRLWEIIDAIRMYSADAVALVGVVKKLGDDVTTNDLRDKARTALVNDITHAVMIAGFNNLEIGTTVKCRILLEHSSEIMVLADGVLGIAYDVTTREPAITVTDVLTFGMSTLNNACDECCSES